MRLNCCSILRSLSRVSVQGYLRAIPGTKFPLIPCPRNSTVSLTRSSVATYLTKAASDWIRSTFSSVGWGSMDIRRHQLVAINAASRSAASFLPIVLSAAMAGKCFARGRALPSSHL